MQFIYNYFNTTFMFLTFELNLILMFLRDIKWKTVLKIKRKPNLKNETLVNKLFYYG